MRWMASLLVSCVLASPGLAQNSAADSENLKALLDEVRQLRRELQTTAVATQRAQILLYRLQLQDAAVARAARQVEEARGKLADIAARRQRVALNIKMGEEESKRSQDAQYQKRFEEEFLPQQKHEDEQLAKEEQDLRQRE